MDITDPNDSLAKKIRDFINSDGGPLVPSAIGTSLPDEYLYSMLGSIEFFRKEFNEISHLNNGPNISLHITRSPGMTTTVRQVDPAHAAIFLPVGVLGRIQIAHKLLLSQS